MQIADNASGEDHIFTKGLSKILILFFSLPFGLYEHNIKSVQTKEKHKSNEQLVLSISNNLRLHSN